MAQKRPRKRLVTLQRSHVLIRPRSAPAHLPPEVRFVRRTREHVVFRPAGTPIERDAYMTMSHADFDQYRDVRTPKAASEPPAPEHYDLSEYSNDDLRLLWHDVRAERARRSWLRARSNHPAAHSPGNGPSLRLVQGGGDG